MVCGRRRHRPSVACPTGLPVSTRLPCSPPTPTTLDLERVLADFATHGLGAARSGALRRGRGRARRARRRPDARARPARGPVLPARLGAPDATRISSSPKGWQGPSPEYRKIEKLELDPLFRAWMTNALFERIARRLIAGPIALYRAVLFTKSAAGGTALPWHQDGGRFWGLDRPPELQIWTALDDCPVEAGCVEVVDGSHAAGLATAEGGVISDALLARRPTPKRRALPLPTRAGEGLLIHNHLWHRSRRESDGTAAERGVVLLHERGDALSPQEAGAADVHALVRLSGAARVHAAALRSALRSPTYAAALPATSARRRRRASVRFVRRPCRLLRALVRAWARDGLGLGRVARRGAVSVDASSEARALAAARAGTRTAIPTPRRSRSARRGRSPGSRRLTLGDDRRRGAAARSRRPRDSRPCRRARHIHYDVRFLVVAPLDAVTTVSEESLALRWFPADRPLGIPHDDSVARLRSGRPAWSGRGHAGPPRELYRARSRLERRHALGDVMEALLVDRCRSPSAAP